MERRRLILLSLAGAAAVAGVFALRDRDPEPGAAPADLPRAVEEGPPECVVSGRPDTAEVVSPDGAPVEGASVGGKAPGEGVLWESFTDARGRVALPRDAPWPYLRARKPGHLVDWWGTLDPAVMQFRLEPAPSVRGRVVLANGTPAVGCSIRAWDEDSRDALDDVLTTDTDGRFEIAGVRLCRPFFVEVSLAGYGPVTVRQLPVDAPEPLVLTLGQGGTISGTVLDALGNPRPGVRVGVVADGKPSPFLRTSTPLADRSGPVGVGWATVDDAGRFRIAGLAAPGAYVVYAADPPLVARAHAFVVAARQRTPAHLTLQQPGGVRVRLHTPDGRPTQANVNLIPRDREEPIYLREAGGAYEVDDLLPIPHELWVRPGSLLPAFRTVVVEPGKVVEVECALERGRDVRVRVTKENGGPVGDRFLYVRWPHDRPGLGVSACEGPDDGGLFTAILPVGAEATAEAAWPGFLPWQRKVGVGETDVDIVLRTLPAEDPRETPERRGVLAGRVVTARDRPVPGARVECLADGRLPTLRTNRAGEFRFEDAPLGRTEVHVSADGHPDLWTDIDPGASVLLRLDAAGEVHGRVVDADGDPFPGGSIPFYAVRDDGSLAREPYRYWESEVDSLGRFVLLLPPGRFQPLFHGPGGSGGRALGPVVEIEEGRIAEVVIQLPWSLKLWH